MRRTLICVLVIFWALWFGGMISLVLFVIRLFNTSRDLGIHAAPVLFRTFSIYQLIVGMVACASGTLLSLKTRSKAHAMATLILVFALADAVIIHFWTNRMLEILAAGQSVGEEFQGLHHKTDAAYAVAALLLLAAGIGWLLTTFRTPARKADESAAV
jgi:hypothetical protein